MATSITRRASRRRFGSGKSESPPPTVCGRARRTCRHSPRRRTPSCGPASRSGDRVAERNLWTRRIAADRRSGGSVARSVAYDLVPSIRATCVPTLADARRRRAALETPARGRRRCHHGGRPIVVPGCRSTEFRLVGIPILPRRLPRTWEAMSPECPPAPSVAITASRYRMWAEARRTRGRRGGTLGLVNTTVVLADAWTDEGLDAGVDRRGRTFRSRSGNSGSAAEINAVCRSVSLISFDISPFRTAIHEVSPNRPSGELTPASGLSAWAVIVQNLIYGLAGGSLRARGAADAGLADRHGGATGPSSTVRR